MNKLWLILISFLIISISLFYMYGRTLWHPYWIKIKGKQTLSQVISQIEPKHNQYLIELFAKNNLKLNQQKVALIAFKDTQVLELWAKDLGSWKKINQYPILKTSGVLGPKLKEGDRQVPEGIYKIIGFNPNSAFHLSMKLNYPNKFDWEKANFEGRNEPGTNIFIHGKESSIGCLAMGDDVIEKLFLLSHKTGLENIEVIISPTDFRKNKFEASADMPLWTPELYQKIKTKLDDFK